MEKGTGKSHESIEIVKATFRNLQLENNNIKSKSIHPSIPFAFQSQFLSSIRGKTPPSLLSLCLGVVGANLEDIIDDLAEIAIAFPSHIKLVLVAIARRRKMLNDDVLIALTDSSWETLDISGSNVSDSGLRHVMNVCQHLRALDISQCSRITSRGVSDFLQLCNSLEILRWGGCLRSQDTARRCLYLLKPNLNNVEGDSWEELDAEELCHGAKSLRWLVWPQIDKDSQEVLMVECPRIVVNPRPSPLGFRGTIVPQEALVQFALDDPIVKDIDPKIWARTGYTTPRTHLLPASTSKELSMAEKFRLAFLERDTRLAPKRAKNARQHQRRAERERLVMDTRAKALALASKATKSVSRNL